MKRWKQLLWFVVPSAVIWGAYLLLLNKQAGAFPVPIGIGNYLRLFLDDTVFWPVLRNTFVPPFLLALVAGGIYYAIQSFLWKKSVMFRDYVILFLVLTIIALLPFSWTTAASGFPGGGYSARSVVALAWNQTLPFLPLFMQLSLLVCFLIWCADGLVQTVQRRALKREGEIL